MMNASNNTYETIAVNEVLGDRFVFYATLPTLQEMASYRAALAIWYSYIARSNYNEFKKKSNDELIDSLGIKDKYWEECNKIVESFKMPQTIEEVLKNFVELVYGEMRSWIRHFKYEMFSYNLKSHTIQQFDANCCVWFPNGKINYGKTGPKMLATPGLTDVQKFAIMSEFCMEDEIRKFPLRTLPKSFIKQVTLERDYLVYYWMCYSKNELRKIPLNNFSSVDVVMAVMCETTHWTAFEYFWNRLGTEDQVTVAVDRFNDHSACLNQAETLSMMSCQQQQRVLSLIPDQILLNFWIRLDLPESAMWTWKHCKHLMPVEKFARVVNEIFYRKVPFEEEMRLLIEMWETASDKQRNHVIQTMEDEIIRPFFFMCNHSLAAFEFLYIFLSMKNEDFRKDAILRNASEFGSNIVDPNSMNKIINLCLPDPDDQRVYRQTIMESHEMMFRGELLFNDSNLESLKLRIQFYSLDENMAKDYLKRLLESNKIRKPMYITDFEKWTKFNDFIDDIYLNDAPSALNLKKVFIMSYASDCLNDWNDDNSLNGMDKVLGTVFTTNELEAIKQKFLNSFRKGLIDIDYWPWFEEKYFNKFVSWCVGNERGVEEFKKTISVDAIFNEYFNRFGDWYSDGGDFDRSLLPDLDKCLKWYFMGVEGAKEYKLRRLDAFENIDIFQNILKEKDESTLDVLLKWFSDGDEESIKKFKAKKIRFTRRT
ncbi:uncharacterized protein LOC135836156 isoform X2 [Planococcus citri]|uniref:uncharacterized protein LOC135836156 isoform X2 n=1 Tax=Planococcus citri TaxID=170843 RepID=UPI0031F93788